MSATQKIGLMVVGDEILSGRRQDAHLAKVIELLTARGMQLAWAQLLPDDLNVLAAAYKRSFASGDVVFSTGGIGSTPDDKTRDAAAKALGVPLVLHPDAAALITARCQEMAKKGMGTDDMGTPENQRRLAMGLFPQGAEIVPNHYNKIPGFYIHNHTFAPGFPEMAWPMFEWTLDTRYEHLHNTQIQEVMSVIIRAFPESRITPALEFIESTWPSIETFSLPTLEKGNAPAYLDVGVRGNGPALKEAYDYLRGQLLRVGAHFMDKPAE